MRYLPTLAAGPHRCTLPMSDGSAHRLVDVALARDPLEWVDSLAAQMAADPPLVLWACCQAHYHGPFQPGQIRDVAEWLAGRAVRLLQWDVKHDDPFEPPDPEAAERLADLVAESLLTADLAALSAAEDGGKVAEEAYLLGLLARAEGSLVVVAGDASEVAAAWLPDWLKRPDHRPAARSIALRRSAP